MSDDAVSIDEILAADPAVVAALEARDPRAWQPLLEALIRGGGGELGEAAPGAFVDALLAVDTHAERWCKRAWDATATMRSAYFAVGLRPKMAFARWFRAGIVATRPAAERVVLRSRLDELQDSPPLDVCDRARVLLDDVRRLTPQDVALQFHVALVLVGRHLEEGAWDEALAAVEQLEAMTSFELALGLRILDGIVAPALTQRLRGAALVGCGELERGLSLVEATLAEGAGPVLHTKRFISGDEPHPATLRELAFQAQCARPGSAEWLAALEHARAVFAEHPVAGADHAQTLARWIERFARVPEPARRAPHAPVTSALHRALHRLLDRLRRDELLAVEPSFWPDTVVEALVAALESAQSESTEDAVALVADALTAAPGVEDLFADDETLTALLREVFGELRADVSRR